MSNVKELTANEVPRLEKIGRAFTDEVGYPAFNLDSFAAIWRPVIDNDLGEVFYFEDEAGEIAGIFGASFIRDPFSGIKTANEQFWFVRGDKRRGTSGLKLLDRFEDEARARGCEYAMMIHLENSKEDVLPKLYARRGYALVERHYRKKL